jgi:YqaJ-like viral recombinase domain
MGRQKKNTWVVTAPKKQKPCKVREVIKVSKNVDDAMAMLKVNESEIEQIEKLTAQQRLSPEWKDYRYGRITSSVVGTAIKAVDRASYPKSMFERLQGGKDLSRIPAVKWGVKKESVALRAFQKLNPNITLQPKGLILHRNGIIGGSPDAVVVEKQADGTMRNVGIVEIKCTYKYRKCTDLYKAIAYDRYFYIDAATRRLKRDHDYWHQIQCMMSVMDVEYAYFVVWTPKAPLHVEKVSRDPNWGRENVAKIEGFYYKTYLPRLMQNKDLQPVPTTTVAGGSQSMSFQKGVWIEEDVLGGTVQEV